MIPLLRLTVGVYQAEDEELEISDTEEH